MREKLFNFMVDFSHDIYYRKEYKISTRRIGNLYSGILLTISAFSIASWPFLESHAVTLALIAFAAQVMQTLKPLLQAERQRQALIYIIQDCETLFLEITDYWNNVGRHSPARASDEEIQEKITDFEKRRQAIVERFAADIDFPRKERLFARAEAENKRYFWYYYDTNNEEAQNYVTK